MLRLMKWSKATIARSIILVDTGDTEPFCYFVQRVAAGFIIAAVCSLLVRLESFPGLRRSNRLLQ